MGIGFFGCAANTTAVCAPLVTLDAEELIINGARNGIPCPPCPCNTDSGRLFWASHATMRQRIASIDAITIQGDAIEIYVAQR